MSVPVIEAPPQPLNEIASNRRRQLLHSIGARAYSAGKKTLKFIVPHGLYKLGKKGKRQAKRARETIRNARQSWKNNAHLAAKAKK